MFHRAGGGSRLTGLPRRRRLGRKRLGPIGRAITRRRRGRIIGGRRRVIAGRRIVGRRRIVHRRRIICRRTKVQREAEPNPHARGGRLRESNHSDKQRAKGQRDNGTAERRDRFHQHGQHPTLRLLPQYGNAIAVCHMGTGSVRPRALPGELDFHSFTPDIALVTRGTLQDCPRACAIGATSQRLDQS